MFNHHHIRAFDACANASVYRPTSPLFIGTCGFPEALCPAGVLYSRQQVQGTPACVRIYLPWAAATPCRLEGDTHH